MQLSCKAAPQRPVRTVAVPPSAPSVIGMMRTPAPKARARCACRCSAICSARTGPFGSTPHCDGACSVSRRTPPIAAVARAAAPVVARTAPVPPVADPLSLPRTVTSRSLQRGPGRSSARCARRAGTSKLQGKRAKTGCLQMSARSSKALDERTNEAEITGETRMMPAPSIPPSDVFPDDNNFSDTQVLKFLETRRADGTSSPASMFETGAISLLKPDDTGTRRALKEAVSENAPVWFAFSCSGRCQPVELAKVPPLAIFSAYTLYTVEGSRDGRKWFGLRLGFFSDAISAKQVCLLRAIRVHVRRGRTVSPQERTRASDVERRPNWLSRSGLAQSRSTSSNSSIRTTNKYRLRGDHVKHSPSRPRPPDGTSCRSRTPPATQGRQRSRRAREARTPQTLERRWKFSAQVSLRWITAPARR